MDEQEPRPGAGTPARYPAPVRHRIAAIVSAARPHRKGREPRHAKVFPVGRPVQRSMSGVQPAMNGQPVL